MTEAQEQRIKARRIPAEYKVYKETPQAVCYVSADGLIAKMFKGTSAKETFWTRFRTPEALDKYVSEYFGRFESWEKMKADRKGRGRSRSAERNIVIKKALKAAFPLLTVSVTSGTGTASCWVNVDFYGITMPMSERQELRKDVDEVIFNALKGNEDLSLSQYYDDYGDARNQLIVQFHEFTPKKS